MSDAITNPSILMERPVVDVTLIDEMLALSPTERLRLNDRSLAMLEDLRRGLEPHQPPR